MINHMGNNNPLVQSIGTKTVNAVGSAEHLFRLLLEQKLYICTVESCTGGALANIITSVPGAGDVLKDSFITYSNEAKIALGVPPEVIEQYTVYSVETAVAMARAGLNKSVRADIGVGITGSLTRADPANPNSVPGQVYLGIVMGDVVMQRALVIPEANRTEARLHIAESAIQAICKILG